jgi:hypothetical protein
MTVPGLQGLQVSCWRVLAAAGDGGLRSAAVLLSIAASVKRHGVNPWAYARHILSE